MLAHCWYLTFFFFSFLLRLLSFGQSGSFVVIVATQSLVVTFANFALRKILRIQQMLIIITSKVPIAHVGGLILTQKLRSKLKWYNAVYVRIGFMGIILVSTLLKRYSTFQYLLKWDHLLSAFRVLIRVCLPGCITCICNTDILLLASSVHNFFLCSCHFF